MHVNAKIIAFSGMLLALTVICMMFGSVIESNTLFLLAAASYFVGIVIREMGSKTGLAFWIAGFILGMLAAPNKFYVFSYAAMGFYILMREIIWDFLLDKHQEQRTKMHIFQIAKYVIFNLLYLPVVLFFPKLIFAGELSAWIIMLLIAGGQIVLLIYDRAYDYVQSQIWGKVRHRFLQGM